MPGVLWVPYAICVRYSTVTVRRVYRDHFYVILGGTPVHAESVILQLVYVESIVTICLENQTLLFWGH